MKTTELSAILPKAVEWLINSALFFLPVSKAASEILFIIALLCWIVHKVTTRSLLNFPSKTIALYGLFYGIILASLTQAAPFLFPEGLRGALKWLKYLGVFLICGDIYSTEERQRRLFFVFLTSMLFVSLDGFYQLSTGKDLLRGQSLDPGRIVRMKACLGAPNLLASFLVFAVPLCGLFIHQSRNRWRALGITSFLIFLSALFLTYSRGAFYALCFSILINLLLSKKFRIAFGSLTFLILLVFSIPSFRYNFLTTLQKKDITILERADYWKVGLSMVKQHPLLGVGVNTYHAKFPLYVKDPKVRQAYPHNSYLQMASEIGIPGTLLFIAALGMTLFFSLKRYDPPTVALRIGLVAFMIQAFFDTGFYALQTAYLFWVFWGVFNASIYFREEESAAKKLSF